MKPIRLMHVQKNYRSDFGWVLALCGAVYWCRRFRGKDTLSPHSGLKEACRTQHGVKRRKLT